jgi:hypothetical protein
MYASHRLDMWHASHTADVQTIIQRVANFVQSPNDASYGSCDLLPQLLQWLRWQRRDEHFLLCAKCMLHSCYRFFLRWLQNYSVVGVTIFKTSGIWGRRATTTITWVMWNKTLRVSIDWCGCESSKYAAFVLCIILKVWRFVPTLYNHVDQMQSMKHHPFLI